MKVVSVEQMKLFEKYTMKVRNCNDLDLMKDAGVALAADFLNRVKPKSNSLISVFAGTGNNGGDALKLVTELQKLGFKPNVFVVGNVLKASNAFLHYFDEVGQVKIIDSLNSLEEQQTKIFAADYIIEGLFGIGLSKPIIGYRNQLISYINDSDTVVYSVDIPSGIHPDNGQVLGIAIKANFTGVVGIYKTGNLLNDAMDYHGDMKLLDIKIIEPIPIKSMLIETKKYQLTLPKRIHNSHKYAYGLGVFIGGSQAMMGSIQMSSMAGLKSGLGIVKVLTEPINFGFTQFYPELMIDSNQGNRSIPVLKNAKVVVFGPGMKYHNNHKVLLDYLLESDIPLVIDGSGFQYIELKQYKNKKIILTPHLGEFSKFLSVGKDEILKNPSLYVKKVTDLGFHILLKGPCNILASEDKVRFIQVSHTGLATAGSGDVLSGIIAGMLVRSDIISALTNAVYVQQTAADYAKKSYGETSMVATDIINNIHNVLRKYENV